ncbi:ABC transporter substrate-binding protein [Halopenitus salinus]|uniref:ABC transporter substrate-binding protein n=1 Tax=Halopenitus salinus TaxID=1198295 RepID=A0ABD5UYJ9_9EURY
MRDAVTRRRMLAATAASVGVPGCLGRAKNVAGRDQPSQVVIRITTRPADSDPHAIRIARHLAENLEAVGIAPRLRTVDQAGLYREVLLNHDFDVYVGRFPRTRPFDPDVLYPLLHSTFAAEPGWQNPFGFTDPHVDDLLVEQRRVSGADREEVVDDLQDELVLHHPFSVIAFPDTLTAVHDGTFSGWNREWAMDPLGLLQLSAGRAVTPSETDSGDGGADGTAADDGRTLRLATTDARPTTNLNPIAPEYRGRGTFTGIVYDPLVRRHGADVLPWLAHNWTRIDDRTVRVELRSTSWHDGTAVSASDVAFTYAFLADTSMGNAEMAIPAPRFRGRSMVVEDTETISDRTVDITFADVNPAVQIRSLTVPILPEHVWDSRTDLVSLPAGIELNERTTDAQVWENPQPIGSGPLQFRERTPEERVVFERNDDHPIVTRPAQFPEPFRGKPAFEALELTVVPSDIVGVQRVEEGLADATTSNLGPDAVPRIGREANVRLVSTPSAGFYHVGFNTRSEPLSNPNLREVIARLVDEEWVVRSAFQGYARPAASPLALSERWINEDLRWDDGDPATPFFGSDGELDVEAATGAIREIGYRYDGEGDLLVREG